MARSTVSAVAGILRSGQGGDYDGETSLQPYLDTANVIVSRVDACAVRKGIAISTAELELIERWLAAHCYASSDQTYAEKTTDKAKGVFHGQTGMFLEGTKYGQMAMRLDPSGCLEAIGRAERKKATVNWLGSTESEQTPYDQRQ